jgi:hypothetical protein
VPAPGEGFREPQPHRAGVPSPGVHSTDAPKALQNRVNFSDGLLHHGMGHDPHWCAVARSYPAPHASNDSHTDLMENARRETDPPVLCNSVPGNFARPGIRFVGSATKGHQEGSIEREFSVL